MASRACTTAVFLISVLSAMVGRAQPGDRTLDPQARVLDIIFPVEVPQRPYFLKMVLRFDKTSTQLVIVVYPDKERYWIRRCDVIKYVLPEAAKTQLSQSLSQLSPEASEDAVRASAAKLKVEVSRFTIAPEALSKSLIELRSIRISPVLAERVSVDEFSEYEFWYDNWQESVHYAIIGAPGKAPQDKLTQWMIKFNTNLPGLLEASSASKP